MQLAITEPGCLDGNDRYADHIFYGSVAGWRWLLSCSARLSRIMAKRSLLTFARSWIDRPRQVNDRWMMLVKLLDRT